jgi:2-C-methyl-D-erythritol 4-phosphate cytidylyltransferase
MPLADVNPLPDPSTLAPPARVFALIACAGQGTRAGQRHGVDLAKQYQPLGGTAMVIHTVQAFRAARPALDGLCVVISPADDVFGEVFPGFGARGEHLFRDGGATRAESVLNGLRALVGFDGGAQLSDWVLVHDAARCLVMPAQIEALVLACQSDPVGGLLALPLADTLKGSEAGRVAATLDRGNKWLAQTPQMFRIGMLIHALERAAASGLAVTDEASAIESLGFAPLLVRGSAMNFKITFPEDFTLAEAVLQSRTESRRFS